MLESKKYLTILYRIQPGCLGPDGLKHVEAFAQVTQKYFNKICTQGIDWKVEPRYDKSLPEFKYLLEGNPLGETQAKRLLSLYDMALDELVEAFQDKLPDLIDQFIAARNASQ